MTAMRATPRDTVTLTNPEAEIALVGSLLIDPEMFAAFAEQVDAEWLSDDAVRAFFEAALKVHHAGGKIGPVTVIANLPDGSEGLGRAELGKLYMRLTDAGVHRDQFVPILEVVRDRWARRTLYGVGSQMTKDADKFQSDPFLAAGEVMASLDAVVGTSAPVDAESLEESSRKLIESLRAREETAGCTTGLKALDAMLNGYVRGQLYVVAARPAMGKSAFALSSTVRTAMAGHGVMFFSLEMASREVSARIHSDLMDHPFAPHFSALMRGKVDDSQIERLAGAHELFAGLPMHFDFSPSPTMREITARARKLRRKWAEEGQRLDVLIVDHLTEIAPSSRYSGNPVMEVSENIKALRVLAKELDCCVICLCQLSREVEKRVDKKPQLSDLRWTGEIEQAAHVVAFLYREHYYLKNEPGTEPWALTEAQNKMEFLVRKNRQGEVDDVHLWCSMAHSSVRDAK